jgi:hypothetical protein
MLQQGATLAALSTAGDLVSADPDIPRRDVLKAEKPIKP